jgi:hypothetical protein
VILSEENEILTVTPKEVANGIKRNIDPRKTPGFDLIAGEIQINFQGKALSNYSPD